MAASASGGGLTVSGNIAASSFTWAGARLHGDQGGSIELGDSFTGGTTPFIDFHYGVGYDQDYNVRLMNDNDGWLAVYGGFWVNGEFGKSSSRDIKEHIVDLSGEEAFTTLQQLNPVKYDYKGRPMFRQNLGFISEEMPDNLASDDRKGIFPFEIIPILTKVIQEQHRLLVELQQSVTELRWQVRRA